MELPIQVAVRIHKQALNDARDGNGNFNENKNSNDQNVEEPNSFVYTKPSDSQRQFDYLMTGGLVHVGEHLFTVTHALPSDCTNSQIFYQTVYPLISLFLEGFDASIITYGQKNTGKTYTLYGREFHCEYNDTEQGVVQYCVRNIFTHIANNSERTYAISVGWVEICQDTIRDLLGVGNVSCKDVAEVFHWLKIGFNAKTETQNQNCGAVHTLFTITLEQQWVSKEGLIQHRLSTASFSDLAASNRIFVESPLENPISVPKDISLRALEQIVYTLTDPALMYSVNGNIHYNQTALTTLLKDSIGGRAQTLVILCVSPLECNATETISNLNFAFKLQCVRNFVVMNTFSDNNTPVPRETQDVNGLSSAVDNFGLQFAASQWLKLVSNAEGLFSKLVTNNSISQLDKEQISEWLFLKQECEECLSSNDVLRSQKQLRPIQETDEPEETLSEPDVSCQQNSDNESDSESQRPDLAERLELLMEELQLKTDTLVKDKYEEFMQRQPKPVMESQEGLPFQKRESPPSWHEKTNEDLDERRASVGGRRRSIHPGTSLSSAELVMLNRVAACEKTNTADNNAVAACVGGVQDDFLNIGSIDIKPLRNKTSPIDTIEKKLSKLNSDIKARMRAIEKLEETMHLKQNIITELEKNSETRSNAKQRFHKKKSKLELEVEKTKKQLDKALLQRKDKSEIERLRVLLEHLEQRLNDLISIKKNIANDSAQKKKLQQSLQESKKEMDELQKKLKKERKLRDRLESELTILKEKEIEHKDDMLLDSDNKKLKEVQARISHLDHVLREKAEKLTDTAAAAAATSTAENNTTVACEALRHEIRHLRHTRDQMVDKYCLLDRKLKREKILSFHEERELLTCNEAIEAIDAVIEFKNELMCGHKSIDTNERLQREKGEQMLMARLNKLSVEEMRTLLYKYFIKVIDLRDSSRKLETQLMQLERERDTWEWKERVLSNAVRQARLEGERNVVLLQREHEMKLTLMLRHFNDETSLSSSGYSDHYHRPNTTTTTAATVAAQHYFNPNNLSLTPSNTDSDFELDFYKNSLRPKMLKPPKHSEIEMCPSLPDAVTKYKPLDKYKDKNKLLAKIQVLTRHAGQSFMQTTNNQHQQQQHQQHALNANHDNNGNALHFNAFDGSVGGGLISTAAAAAAATTGGHISCNKKKKDKNQKEIQLANFEAIPQENLKRLIATPTTTKVTRSKNKIIIQDASRKN